jgi:hypothetical protein
MIVVRDIFQVKYGRAREVLDLFKEGIAMSKSLGYGALGVRLLTDLIGEHYYTVIMETTFESVAEWEQAALAARGSAQWKAWYQKVVPLIDTGERKMYSVVA